MQKAVQQAVIATQNLTRTVLEYLPRNRQKTITALEWGSGWVKVAQVLVSAKGKRLVRLEAVNIPSPEELPKTVRELLKDRSDGSDYKDSIIISLPRNLVTLKNLRLPTSDPVELKEMVGLQVTRQTPYSKDEVITDFRVVGTPKEGFRDVILAIATREVSDGCVNVLETGHLKTGRIHLSSFGVFNGYRMTQGPLPEEGDGAVAIVDVDSNFTDFIVVSGRQLVFTKVMFIGVGKLEEGEEEWIEKFKGEMRGALDLYENEGVGKPVQKVIVTGAQIESERFNQSLMEQFSFPAECNPLFDKVPAIQQMPAFSEIIQKKSLSFSAVLGLAWNPTWAGIDLTPAEIGLKEGFAKRVKNLMIMAALLLSILMVFSGMVSARLYFKSQYLSQLRQEVQKTDEKAREVERLRKEIKIVKESRDIQSSSIEVLSLLYKLIPPEIYFNAVTFKKREYLILTGAAEEMSDVFKFVTVLEKQPVFNNVKIKQLTKRKKQGGREQSDFEITCFLTGEHGQG